MRRPGSVIVALVVALVLTGLAAQPAPAAGTGGGIVGSALAGIVRDDDGRVLSDVRVEAYRIVAGEMQDAAHDAITDGQGRYLIDRLLPGTYALEFYGDDDHAGEWWGNAPSFAASTRIVLQGGQVERADASLGDPGILRGRVVTLAGGPIAGVDVAVHGARVDQTEEHATSDADGRWEVPISLARPVYVYTSTDAHRGRPGRWYGAPDGQNDATPIVVPVSGTASITQPFPRGGTIVGRITIAGTAQPAADLAVGVVGTSAAGPSARTDADGRFVLAGVLSGERRVAVSGTNDVLSRDDFARIVVPVDGEVTAELVVQPAAHIEGRVTDENGSPIQYARAVVEDQYDIVTDADGRYRVDGLRPGPHTVLFSAPNRPTVDVEVDLLPGRTTTGVDAMLRPGATLSGTIRVPDGQPLDWVSVHAYRDGEILSGDTVFPGSDGRFTLTGLRAGTYRIFANTEKTYAPTWWGQAYVARDAGTVTVDWGGRADGHDITLMPGSSLTGTVRTADGSPAHRVVEVTAIDGLALEDGGFSSTDTEGRWSLTTLRPGTYRVAATCRDGSPDASVVVSVGIDDAQEADDIVLPSGQDQTCEPRILPAGSPRIAGQARVGRTVAVRPWKVRTRDVLVTYSWWAGSRRIATSGTELRIPRSARGKRVHVRARLTRAGYRPVVVRSPLTRRVR